MKFKTNEFRTDTALPVEAPLDFPSLCALLAAHQAEMPTAKLARVGAPSAEQLDHGNPAVAVLLAAPGREKTTNGTPGSFHAAAAACFNGG
jgi:hypothetical protein